MFYVLSVINRSRIYAPLLGVLLVVLAMPQVPTLTQAARIPTFARRGHLACNFIFPLHSAGHSWPVNRVRLASCGKSMGKELGSYMTVKFITVSEQSQRKHVHSWFPYFSIYTF
jgi:hypothetical protein